MNLDKVLKRAQMGVEVSNERLIQSTTPERFEYFKNELEFYNSVLVLVKEKKQEEVRE